ncbi:molecular chaperone [Rhodotorula toruloides]
MHARVPRQLLARTPAAHTVAALPRAVLPIPRPSPPSSALGHPLQRTPAQWRRVTTASQTVYTTGGSCPGCGAPLPQVLTPVCPKCTSLLPPPPPSATYFALFDIEPTFDIDVKALKRKFLQMQQKVHPDMFSGKGEVEEWAKAWSGRVNDAHKALTNERERGEYLLSLHDVNIGEADPVTDPELLMTIMETREELEEAETEGAVAAVRERNKESTKSVIASLSSAFSSSPPDLEAARNLVIELKYLNNIDQVCREWQPGKRLELQD